MGIVAKQNSGNRLFINAPADTYQAVCVDVVDLGILPPKNPAHKPAHKINLVFQLDEVITEKMIKAAKKAAGDASPLSEGEKKLVGQRLIISNRYTLSLHENALLRKTLTSWRGEDLSQEELDAGFDVEQVIGWNASINVVHNKVGDKVYANIMSIAPWKTKFGENIKPEGYVRKVDRNKDDNKAAGTGSTEGDEDEDSDNVPFSE